MQTRRQILSIHKDDINVPDNVWTLPIAQMLPVLIAEIERMRTIDEMSGGDEILTGQPMMASNTSNTELIVAHLVHSIKMLPECSQKWH